MTTARVVGAGLSGLAAAWFLRDAGFQVEVIDAAPEPGGLIGTTTTPHGLVERAANAFVATPTTLEWFARLDLDPFFPLETSRHRFIYRDGKPRRWPLRRMETAAMAARLALQYTTRRLRPREDETVTQFVERVAGGPAARWFVAPALQGVYASSTDRLSAAAVFGGPRRARGGSVAPPRGMGEFVERLHDRLRQRGVSFALGASVDFLGGRVPTVVCTSGPAAEPLVRPHAPALADALRRVETTGLETVTAFFEPHPADLDGFGVLFPRGCGVDALGVLFNTSIFRGRGTLRSETWIYGIDSAADAPAAGRVQRDREILTGRDATPVALFPTRRPNVLPVYDRTILEVRARLTDLPSWLTLSGNYLGQIGVSALLARAEAVVRDLVRSHGA